MAVLVTWRAQVGDSYIQRRALHGTRQEAEEDLRRRRARGERIDHVTMRATRVLPH